MSTTNHITSTPPNPKLMFANLSIKQQTIIPIQPQLQIYPALETVAYSVIQAPLMHPRSNLFKRTNSSRQAKRIKNQYQECLLRIHQIVLFHWSILLLLISENKGKKANQHIIEQEAVTSFSSNQTMISHMIRSRSIKRINSKKLKELSN